MNNGRESGHFLMHYRLLDQTCQLMLLKIFCT